MAPAKQTGAEIEIDPNSDALSQALDHKSTRYRKTGEVRASRAIATQAVDTILSDGTEETRNVAAPGDFINTGQGGERYVVKPSIFRTRYWPRPRKKGVYNARGTIVAIPNPFGRPICLKAPWGQMQRGSADCMIADIVDPESGRRAGQPYLIARAEFERTYVAV
jgi:PGDYG protein